MTPAAHLQAAIDILVELERKGGPADRTIEKWGRDNRYAGSKDRAAIAERVFGVLRRRAEIVHRMHGREDPRSLVIGSIIVVDETPENVVTLFSQGRYGPKPLSFDERHALLNPPAPPTDLATRYNVPAWILPQLEKTFGAEIEPELAALSLRAPLDIRVNTIKAERDDVQAALATDHTAAAPTPWSPLGLRITDPNARQVTQSESFAEGQFEIQDDASQCASLLVEAHAGETIVDLCAGAGGKTLALAATMENKGKIVACDIEAASLEELKRRANRAGTANIIETRALAKNWDELARGSKLDDLEAKADRVLVDAPCSGSGTWRRNPGLKWRLTSAQLNAMKMRQLDLLKAAERLVRPGGFLVYVTCSLLPAENEDIASALLKQSTSLKLVPAADRWRRLVRNDAPPGIATFARLTPASSNTDGFFIATFQKKQ